MESYFLPALTASVLRQLRRMGWLLWFDKPHPNFYPHVLMCYAWWTNDMVRQRSRLKPWIRAHAPPKARRAFTSKQRLSWAENPFPDVGYRFGDSGGFQVRRKNFVFDPIDVLEWQEANCSVGAILDVPIRDKKGNLITSSALDRTVELTRRALPTYQVMLAEQKAFRWWGVIHGMPGADRERWWRQVERVYPFAGEGEGWAILPQPKVDPVGVASAMRFAQQSNLKRVHILMCGVTRSTAALLVLARQAGLEFLTYDASSAASAGAGMRNFYIPTPDGLVYSNIRERFLETGGEDQRGRNFLLKECMCVSCQEWRDELDDVEEFRKQPHKFDDPMDENYVGYRVLVHNLLTQFAVNQRLTEESKRDPDAVLKAVLKPRIYSAVLRTFEGHHSIATESGDHHGLLDYL